MTNHKKQKTTRFKAPNKQKQQQTRKNKTKALKSAKTSIILIIPHTKHTAKSIN
jgi:hypothetical protein